MCCWRVARGVASPMPLTTGKRNSPSDGRSRITPCASTRDEGAAPSRRNRAGVRSVISTRIRFGDYALDLGLVHPRKRLQRLAPLRQRNAHHAAAHVAQKFFRDRFRRHEPVALDLNLFGAHQRYVGRIQQRKVAASRERESGANGGDGSRQNTAVQRPRLAPGSSLRISTGFSPAQVLRLVFGQRIRVEDNLVPALIVPLPWLDHFFFQFHAVAVAHPLAHVGDQREHVRRGGVSGIDEKIGVAVAHAGVADRVALQTQLVDHASGGPARRILENTSCAFLIERLTGTPLLIADANSLKYFAVRFGRKFQSHREHNIIEAQGCVPVAQNLFPAPPEDFYPLPVPTRYTHFSHEGSGI